VAEIIQNIILVLIISILIWLIITSNCGGILSGRLIRKYRLVEPHVKRTTITRPDGIKLTYGEGPAGYDVRAEFDDQGIISQIILTPGEFRKVSTIEHISLPSWLVAEIADKSTWIRQGLTVHNSKGCPGWDGFLTIELSNHGSKPITIYKGDPIAHILFHTVKGIVDPYNENDKYQHQGRGPQMAR